VNAGGASPLPDPFLLRDNWDKASFPRTNSVQDGLTPVNPNLVGGQTTCVLIAGGQSTITNCGTSSSYTKTNSNVHVLNIYNGGMYSAVNPLPGIDSQGECFLIRLADKMINAAKYQRIILVPFGLGSTDIAKWQSGAFCNERITAACQRVSKMGLLSATQVYVMWQQGESDKALGTSQAAYTAALTGTGGVIPTIRSVLPSTPIYVSQTSWASGTTSTAVRAAQAASWGTNSVVQGPDTDTLDATNRLADNTHWNGTGSDAVAGLWNAKLA
jgi:hypothetical protein